MVAGEGADHRRCRHLLRRLRRAGDRIGAAGHRPALEADPATDRADDLGRLPRTIAGRVVVRLDRGALRADDGHDLVDRAVRGDEPRLRAGVGLRLAAGAAHHPRHRARRRGASRCRLHQRAGKGAGPRALRAVVRARVPDRPGGGKPRRIVGRAASRLAIHVRHRRAAGVACARAAQRVAGIPTLACGARPPRRGRGGDVADRDANAEGNWTAAAAGEAGRVHLGQGRLLGRSLRLVLPAPHAGRVGDLVRGVLRELRARDLVAHRL